MNYTKQLKNLKKDLKDEKLNIRIFTLNKNDIYEETVTLNDIPLEKIKSSEYYLCVGEFCIQNLNIDSIGREFKGNINLNDYLNICIYHKKDLILDDQSLKGLKYSIDLF